MTATNSAGSTIARTEIANVPALSTPAVTKLPAISGIAAIGKRLTCKSGTWTGQDTATGKAAKATALTLTVGGPPRLAVAAPSAIVSSTGAFSIPVTCVGQTTCSIPNVTVTRSGKTLARGSKRTVRPGATSKVTLKLSGAAANPLRRAGAALAVRVLAPPSGGTGGNSLVELLALRGVR